MINRLILNANMICKADRFIPKKCAVEKVIEVSDSEFRTFIENPMKRNYYLPQYKDLMGYYDDSYHGVLFVNMENGDGLLVNSAGYDYARYSQYIPNASDLIRQHEQTAALDALKTHMDNCIDKWLEKCGGKRKFDIPLTDLINDVDFGEFFAEYASERLSGDPRIESCELTPNDIEVTKCELVETRLYCPLKIMIEDEDCCDLIEVDSANYIDYDSEINAHIRDDLNYDEAAIKEHWHCDGCGKDFEDKDGTKEVTADDLRIGKIETVVEAPVNFPKPVIATPEEELVKATLTEEEQKKVDEGAIIKIILKVEDATNTVQSEDKTAVTDKLGELTNYKLGQYLDVTLLKKIGEQQEQKIANTSKPISITFEIPESLRGKSEYSVIRVHGDEATILRDLDSDPNTVTIETDKFSTYALTYKEKTSGGGSGGDGSSHRHRYIYDEKMIKEPTCTESGEKSLSCSCGQTTTETVPALGHDYHSEITKPATETENGIRTFTCTRCGDSYTELIEKTSDETSDNTPSDTSESTSGDTSDNMPSDTSDNTSSNIADSSASDNSSSGESSHIPSESGTSSGDNPATGIAVSLIPLTVAVAVVIATAKRRYK